MPPTARTTATFPSARIASASGGLPVEVALIAQLGHGSGDRLFADMLARQHVHPGYVDALDEPSAKLAGTDFGKGDVTSLYSFAVGAQGHPFHRHAGQRLFTAISGSDGARLRFSTASPEQLRQDPANFLRALRQVEIPPDCLFSVRFGGGTWHQFAPLTHGSRHPALFALSCHPNELGGELPDSLKQQVLADAATIPALTELLPSAVTDLLEASPPELRHMPAIALSLDVRPGSLRDVLGRRVRGLAGSVRAGLARRRRPVGFHDGRSGHRVVLPLPRLTDDSLLRDQLGHDFHHEDMFVLGIEQAQPVSVRASDLLERLLEGFIHHPPAGVSRMMALRNLLVRPLGLRTSRLGCPASSLLSSTPQSLFHGRYPVLAQSIDAGDTHAQVILGADDKHLQFRSCVAVRSIEGQRIELSLSTRVRCKNLFGHVYMALIERVHRRYVSPAMLRMATEYAFGEAAATRGDTMRRPSARQDPALGT